MSTRKINLVIGEYYHLYSRGTEKRNIFCDKSDYEHFLFLMYIFNTENNITLRDVDRNFVRGESIVDIGAYCLMPNHFHILIKGKTENGISKYMLKLLTGYTMYFNKKYERTGRLYEGIFKSTHVNNDNYLKYLYSYIHLNPAKLMDKNWKENSNKNSEEILNYVFKYPYSSVKEYSNLENKILNPKAFPNYFEKIEDNKKELTEWINFSEIT